MVRFAENVYTTDSTRSRLDQIKWKTVCGIGMLNVYFITPAMSGKDLFDIYSAVNFKQRSFRKSNLVILGVAGGESEAYMLVENIINDALEKCGDVTKIRNYINSYIDN